MTSLMVNLTADLPKNESCLQAISWRRSVLLKSAVLPGGDVGHGVGSGMLASILLVGRSPWSTRSPCRHDRLLDGRVECHPTNGMILVVPDDSHPTNGMILSIRESNE
jgi:hypothetical protein